MKKIYWILFGAVTLVIRQILGFYPHFTEKYYTNGIFKAIRMVLDYGLGWLPFPATYLLFALVFWLIVDGLLSFWMSSDQPFPQRLLQLGGSVLAFISGTIGIFYWVWGFNYNRLPIEQHLQLPEITMNEQVIRNALEEQTHRILQLRTTLQPDTSQLIPASVSSGLTASGIRQTMESGLPTLGYGVLGRPHGRQPFWKGFLLRFGAAGIYNPFTGECNVDKGLAYLSLPYTMAHELGHGYGFGDEGTCNFLAYWALKSSADPFYKYSGELGFWRELAGTYSRLNPPAYKQLWDALPGGFQKDIIQIHQINNQYPEYFEAFRVQVYDEYLKAQGIAEGMQNYSKIITLALALKQQQAQ